MNWDNLQQRFIASKTKVDDTISQTREDIMERFRGYMKHSTDKASIIKIDNPIGIKELVFQNGYCQVIGVNIPQPFYIVPEGMSFSKEVYVMSVEDFFVVSLLCEKFYGKIVFNVDSTKTIGIFIDEKGETIMERSSSSFDKNEQYHKSKEESWDFKPTQQTSIELIPLELNNYIKLIATNEYEDICSLKSETGDRVGTICKSKYIDGYVFFKHSFKSTHRWEGQPFFQHGWSIDKNIFSEHIVKQCKAIHVFDVIEVKDKTLLKIHYFTTPNHYVTKGWEHNYSDRGTQICLPVVNKFKNIKEGDNWIVFVEFNVEQDKPWWKYYSERGHKNNG